MALGDVLIVSIIFITILYLFMSKMEANNPGRFKKISDALLGRGDTKPIIPSGITPAGLSEDRRFI